VGELARQVLVYIPVTTNNTTGAATMTTRINKTAALTAFLDRFEGRSYSGPDCRNRHPGTGWEWSPSGTATTASPVRQPCWHGSAPTPGTQLPEEIARAAAEWLEAWDLGYVVIPPTSP
jgi:hypothetical protein